MDLCVIVLLSLCGLLQGQGEFTSQFTSLLLLKCVIQSLVRVLRVKHGVVTSVSAFSRNVCLSVMKQPS